MLSTDRQIRSVGLTSEQLQLLLDSLDAASPPTAHPARRSERLRYRSPRVRVHVLDRHQEVETSFGVATRNISSHGLAFIHRQVLAPGQLVSVEIPLLDDQILLAAARVVRCRHLNGMLHEIGVEFVKSARRRGSGMVDKPQIVRR